MQDSEMLMSSSAAKFPGHKAVSHVVWTKFPQLYFLLAKWPSVRIVTVSTGSVSNLPSRFVSPNWGEKVKRNGFNAQALKWVCKARFRSFHIVCRCVFASLDSRVFWLLSLSTLIAALGFVFYVLRSEKEFCLYVQSSELFGVTVGSLGTGAISKFEMWISSRWRQPPKLQGRCGGVKSARKRCRGQRASTVERPVLVFQVRTSFRSGLAWQGLRNFSFDNLPLCFLFLRKTLIQGFVCLFFS